MICLDNYVFAEVTLSCLNHGLVRLGQKEIENAFAVFISRKYIEKIYMKILFQYHSPKRACQLIHIQVAYTKFFYVSREFGFFLTIKDKILTIRDKKGKLGNR